MGAKRITRRPPFWVGLLLFSLLAVGLLATVAYAGPPMTSPFLITPDLDLAHEYHPAVAYNPTRKLFLVAWDDGTWVYRRTVDEQGAVQDQVVPVALGSWPDVAYNSALDNFLLVWCKEPEYEIWGLRLSGDGKTIIGAFPITPGRPDLEQYPAVAFNSTSQEFLVVWVDGEWLVHGGTHWTVWGQRVSGAGIAGDPLGAAFQVAGSGPNGAWWHGPPDIAYNYQRNEYMVVFGVDPTGGSDPSSDIYGSRLSAAGQVLAEHIAIDWGPGDQTDPAIAAYPWNPAMPYLVVYTDMEQLRDPLGNICAYLLDADGQPQVYLALAANANSAEITPAVTSSEKLGGYLVLWARRWGSWDIWARQVKKDGTMWEPFTTSHDGFELCCNEEKRPAVAGGSPVALAVWESYFTGLLGYKSEGLVGRIIPNLVQMSGFVYQTDGGTSTPLAGVTIRFYGDLDADPANGLGDLLASATTDSGGSFTLTWQVTDLYPWYHLVEEDPAGMVSRDAEGGDYGSVSGGNVVTFDSALADSFNGIAFYDVVNTAPSASFTVSPEGGDVGTVFQFDASGCSDNEEDAASLQVHWDWEDDGTYDTGWSTAKTASHAFGSPNLYTVRLQVIDSGGLTAEATRQVTVASAALPPEALLYLPVVLRNYRK